ncbi:MAG: S41 family peptidase, partial [Candidatus Gracilibacteria bacterium]|nr:S41 family peptidase [Candidatus Gracilibacteria bacterium]
SLRGVNLQLRDKELEIVATALEQGLFSEPQDRTESRLLKNKLTRGSISNADAMTFLYQTAVSAHQQPVITITNISEPSETFELEQILKSVIDTIRTDSYYKADFNEKAAVENAIKALVGSLEQDHYIEFYTEEEFQMFSSGLNGTVEGIGAYIEEKEGVIYVVSPIEGSPASKAGLHPGDIITHVDNVSTDGMSIQEAVNRIRGTNGTSVKLSIRRGTQSLEFNIVRSRVDIPELIHKKQDGIDILKLTQFGNNSSNEMRNVLEEISAGNPKGLIIDLRNNPGGFLMEVINILDLFLEPGEPIVYVKNRTDQEIFKGNVKPIITGVPIVILINKGSASASEILAGALQGHSLAKIIGEISFGKGTVQNIISFQGGSAFKYTTAEYLVPGKQKNSVSINNIGVYPDSNPAGTDPKNFVDNPDTPEDEVLDAALKMLK